MHPESDPRDSFQPAPAGPEPGRMAVHHRRGCVAALGLLLLAGCFLPLGAQEEPEDQVSSYVQALQSASGVSVQEKMRIIAFFERNYAGSNSALVTNMLFYACNPNMEASPEVREAAALAVGGVCDLNNTMHLQRLSRVADPGREPAPQVRMAALRSLARSRRSFAGETIREAGLASGDPDPEVRQLARKLIEGNPDLPH
jgi:hypothetical protein